MITRKDLTFYKTISGLWRVYVKGNAGLQGFGIDPNEALSNLTKALAAKTFAFDLSDIGESVNG